MELEQGQKRAAVGQNLAPDTTTEDEDSNLGWHFVRISDTRPAARRNQVAEDDRAIAAWGLLLRPSWRHRDSFLGKLPVRCQGCGDASPIIGVLRASETPVRGVVYSDECRRREYICGYFGAARFATAFRGS
jgi:hypothetical protein